MQNYPPRTWDDYFGHSRSELVGSQNLQEQLIEADDDVFHPTAVKLTVTDLLPSSQKQITVSIVENDAELDEVLSTSPQSAVRIISFHSDRTISPLRITSGAASKIFNKYQIKPDFLRILLYFGHEPNVADSSSGNDAYYQNSDDDYVILYKLNYVEQNRRGGQDPWSSRHVAVYHHHRPDLELFVLVHCTEETALVKSLSRIYARDPDSRPLDALKQDPVRLHELVISSYADNWGPYLRYLGNSFSDINNQAMVVKPEQAGQDSFKRVQRLRNSVDFTLFANACCQSNLGLVRSLLSAALALPAGVRDRLRARENVLHGHVESCKILEDRIRNAIDLVGYTLSLRNQMETAKLDREIRDMTEQMKNLAQETSEVTRKLQQLTQHTVDDSAVVSVITIVSAIYLPGSFVGTMFGMNFFTFDATARTIAMSKDIWIFVLVWLFLTGLTGGGFFLVYWRKRNSDRSSNEKQGASA